MISKSVKEKIISSLSEQMSLPESLIHCVISFQGEDAAKASHIYNEIEFSGFGKFSISQPRIKKDILVCEQRLSNNTIAPEKREIAIELVNKLKNRIR